MTDRRNRVTLTVIGLLLAVGGGLSCALGGGAFGTRRSDRAVFDSTVVHWWNEGGWMSFATVVAIGVVAAVIGLTMMLAQLRRNDGRRRLADFAYPVDRSGRGETSVRASSLSHCLEEDLQRLPGVGRALVGIFGRHPDPEIRAVVEVADDTDLEGLRSQVGQALARLNATTSLTPSSVQVTLRFNAGPAERQLA